MVETPDIEIVELKTLEIGDMFRAASDLKVKPTIFLIRGNPVFNARHGSATRCCCYPNLKSLFGRKRYFGKSCKLKVIKISESKHKNFYKEYPLNVL